MRVPGRTFTGKHIAPRAAEIVKTCLSLNGDDPARAYEWLKKARIDGEPEFKERALEILKRRKDVR